MCLPVPLYVLSLKLKIPVSMGKKNKVKLLNLDEIALYFVLF